MKTSRGFYDVFVRTCAKHPRRTAVRHYDSGNYKLYTYSELYGICEYLSQTLQQLHCHKSVIGLITDRNVIVPCLIAATHKCETTFMFLDTKADIELQAKELGLKVIIAVTQDDNNDLNIPLKDPDKNILVFGYNISFYSYQPQSRHARKGWQGPSFIVMTSGSTGKPKQVEVPITCIQPNIDDLTKLFMVTTRDVIYFSTPLTFDPSIIEVQLAIMNGASLLIAPEIGDIIFPTNHRSSVTIWQTTPSKFFQYPDEKIRGKILSADTSLRILALGGEPLKGVKRLSILKQPGNQTKIFTLYGVTEMSCWSCVAELDLSKICDDKEIPLGHCLSETNIIVDTKNHTYGGKILLVSSTRKCEILNQTKDATSDVIDTGDLGERKNGNIYFRGRLDDIVKRFGHKINLQTIETTVMLCPNVQTCSCVWLPTPKLVVVYFCSATMSSQELSDYLRCKLNEKHWPDKVIRVDSLPTNSHGKASKALLSKNYLNFPTAPQTMLSLKLSFLEELKVLFEGNFTYDDIKNKDFFTLGGTSFVAVTLCNRLSNIHKEFGKFILPHLITPKNSIDQIMEKAEGALSSDIKKTKAKKKKSSSPKGVTGICKKPKISVPPNYFMEFHINWSYNTGKCVDCSPTLFQSSHNVYVVVGSHSGKIVIFDAAYGALKGVIRIKSRIEASVLCYHEMPMDIPCGVVGAYDGTVVCFKLNNAKTKWRVNIGAMVKSKAVQCCNFIYVAAYDGAIHYLDMKTGETKGAINVTNQPISADLVVTDTRLILVATLSGLCACINAETNTIVWQNTVSSPIFAQPVLYDDGKYAVFAEVTGDIHCRSVPRGGKIWKFKGAQGNLFSSMYLKDSAKMEWQLVFGCHDSNVYSLLVRDSQPSLHWRTAVGAPVYSTPCSINQKYILAAAKSGTLYVLNESTGAILSEYKLPNETFSSPAVYNNTIFIGCRDDHIYGLKYAFPNENS